MTIPRLTLKLLLGEEEGDLEGHVLEVTLESAGGHSESPAEPLKNCVNNGFETFGETLGPRSFVEEVRRMAGVMRRKSEGTGIVEARKTLSVRNGTACLIAREGWA